jgi:hypothetical protein
MSEAMPFDHFSPARWRSTSLICWLCGPVHRSFVPNDARIVKLSNSREDMGPLLGSHARSRELVDPESHFRLSKTQSLSSAGSPTAAVSMPWDTENLAPLTRSSNAETGEW